VIYPRRDWLLAAAALAGCSPRKPGAGCGELAGKTIRWIVPFAAGGGYEVMSRLFEPYYEKALDAEILVVNEPGNGGVVGAAKLRDAAPDGRTLGILNAPGLFTATLAGDSGYPNPARDFTVLGRLARNQSVLAVAASSPLKTVGDLIAHQKRKPLACGVSGIGSNNMLILAASEALLGIRFDYISGIGGSREDILSVMRGDTDLMSGNFDSLEQSVDAGDLRVLAQIADGPDASEPALRGVAWLGGPEGWAARRARELNRDEGAAIAEAAALVELVGAGIIACAPKGLPADLSACMKSHFLAAASSTAFRAAAQTGRRTLDVAPSEETLSTLTVAERHVARFAPLVREAFRRARK